MEREGTVVKVINLSEVKAFQGKHAHSRAPLGRWVAMTVEASWKGWAEVKRTFKTVDHVGPYAVFKIHGNHYRLVATINFATQTVVVQRVMTHTEYDRWKP